MQKSDPQENLKQALITNFDRLAFSQCHFVELGTSIIE